MATAGSRDGRLQQADSSATQQPIDPPSVVDDGEFALEGEHFWPPETDVDRDPLVPSVPKPRRRRGTRSQRDGYPQVHVSSPVANQPTAIERPVATPFEPGPRTGNDALVPYELMEAIALAAAHTDDDAHSARLVAAIVPLAFQLTPDVTTSLWPLLPDLLAATARVAEVLRRRPANRPLLALLPLLLRRTVAELRQRTLDRPPLTGDLAAQMLTQQAAIVFPVRRGSGASAADTSAASTI